MTYKRSKNLEMVHLMLLFGLNLAQVLEPLNKEDLAKAPSILRTQ